MRRKANYYYSFENIYNPEKANPELLKAVGHMTFLWNDIERAIDRSLVGAIEAPIDLQREISSRINGIEGKIEILKEVVENKARYSDDEAMALRQTLGALMEFKQARDAVIHARISDEFSGIAPTFERRGELYEVLITEEALDILNGHLVVLRLEMAQLVGIFTLQRVQRPWSKLFGPSAGPLFDKEFSESFSRLRVCQEKRRSFPKLLKAPDAPPPPPHTVKSQRRSER